MLSITKISPKLKLGMTNSLLLARILIAAVYFIITFAIVINGAAPIKYDLKVNDTSRTNILAPRDIEDKLTTKRLQDEAAEKVSPRYDLDNIVTNRSLQKIYDFFSDVQKVRQADDMTTAEKITKLRELSQKHIPLSEQNLTATIQISDNELSKLQITVLNVHRQTMNNGVQKDELDKVKDEAKQIIEKVEFSPQLLNLSFEILDKVIEPNKILNQQATQELIEKARKSIEPVYYKEGEKILGEGDKVTPEHIAILKELNLLKGEGMSFDYRFVTGVFFIVALLFAIVIGYLFYFNKRIFNDQSDLILLGLIFVASLSFAALLKPIDFKYIFLVPLITAPMLIAILLDTRLAIIINFVLSVLIALIYKGDSQFIGVALFSGTFSAFAVTKTNQRSRLVLAGVIISVINALLTITYGLLGKNELKQVLLMESSITILYSLLAIFLTIGVLPFLEATFNVVTPLKLLELSNPNQPLIKKLLLEAPGTYHHSLMVGNLAEAATEAIGGNALLARVAAYYHDIGKLKRPYFFKENQFNDNPHDRMTPNLSTLVITSHTKDGEAMAKNHKLPMIIRDIIKQHHGTTLVAYFYHKAKQGEKTELVNPEDFRYEGPKPQTKEAAVVMLADCVEAAVRSMSERTEGKIEGMVRKIIKDKLDDGQLNMCDLTLKDLDTIAKAFLRALSGFFHERIEYPEVKVKDDDIVIVEAKETI